jgi:TadE-like protein
MKLPFVRRRQRASRGQAMVEFALILPLLVLLLVMAIDFGRVFFGWIALQNATRIAADTAAQRANAWPSADGNLEQEWRLDYENFITQDLQAANCIYPTPHPDPVFTNANPGAPGDTGDHDFGDLVTVHLACEFSLITPFAEAVFGGPIPLEAEATFAINGLVVVGVPDPPSAPPDPCVAPVATFDTVPAPSAGGRVNGNTSPLVVDFTSTTAENPDCPNTYLWERRTGSGPWSTVGTATELLDQVFTDNPGGGPTNYEVRLTVTNSIGSDPEVITVRVSA